MKLRKKEKTLTMAAAKAGMARNTARKYLKSGKLPSECRPERTWRTRPDPYESVWPEVEGILKRSPTVEATTVFDHQRWTPSVGPLGGISKVDSAVLVAASKGNSERGRA